MNCLKCKADMAHRSHSRGIVEHLLRYIDIHPYRCHGCQHRFLRFRDATREPGPAISGQEREVKLTRNAIRWRRKRREFLLYGSGLLIFAFFLYCIARERGVSPDSN